jgi:gamma-glutamylputrescine oxidase
MNLSFWERNSLQHYQHIIVGCGFVGMHIALQLRHRFPKDDILILEKGILPEGASTKNAGFACTGSPTELLADIAESGEQSMLQLFEMRFQGLQFTRQILGDTAIDYKENGSHELLSSTEVYCLDELNRLNKLLFPIIGKNAFAQNDECIIVSGFNASTFKHAVQHFTEGAIDTGKLVKRLLALCGTKNIDIKFGAEVQEITDANARKVLLVKGLGNTIEFTCNNVFVATNAFAQQLLPSLDVQPGRGQVLITKPIANLKLKGIFHLDEGYYYFREVQNRILFGGGRNLNFAAEATSNFGITDLVQNELLRKLHEDILPNTAFEIDYTWSGIMAFGANKQPIVQKINEGLFCAVRCGGMGVAIAPVVAKNCVDLL